ncbi:hypothetical protein GNQ08_23835 [Paenibacillus macerans]|uniref:Uncharacterized protein n=1 Tax=Paenibacillus macerans TaxID=44252 RepID=A0A6N8F4M2_PAEMA|nr:hypothetical protein [Paenibacillus macerans]MUG25402.1 hypothetical protein [Paenibacillus macerans]
MVVEKNYKFIVLKNGAMAYGGARVFPGTSEELEVIMQKEIEVRGPSVYIPGEDLDPSQYRVLTGKRAKVWEWERERRFHH